MPKTTNVLNRIITISIYGLVFFLPFSRAGIEIWLHIGIVAWVIKRFIIARRCYSDTHNFKIFFKSFRLAPTPLNKPVYTLAIVSFISTLFGVDIALGFEGILGKLYTYIFVFFLTVEVLIRYNPAQDKKTLIDLVQLHRLLGVILFSIFLIILDGVTQYVTGKDFLRGFAFGGRRLQASFDNPNDLAGWIITLFPLLLASFFYLKENMKPFLKRALFVIYPLSLIGAIFLIGMTFSRGAWFGYGVGMVFLSAIILRGKDSGGSGKRRKEKGLLILAISCIIVPLAAGLIVIEPIAKRIETLEEGLEEAGHRKTNWKEAAAIVEDSPLLGTGPNTYTLVGPNYSLREGGGIYPHNCYLQIAAETGILGLAAFLWIIFRFFKLSLKKIKEEGSILLLGINSGVLAYLVQSFFDTNLFSLKLAVLFWFMLGLGTSLFYYEDR